MFEELLEDEAQNNGLREVNTWVKLAAGLGSLLLCLLSEGYAAPLLIALLLSAVILTLARINARFYAELFLVPVWFALASSIVIVLVSGGRTVFWNFDAIPFLSLSVTKESNNQGFFILCRVVGGTSALLFIALTTPMTDLFIVMRRCRIPDFIIDLAMIIYRTIFFLLDQVRQIYHAQVMRLGYFTWRESIMTFSMMCGAAFIASWDAGDDLIRAMDARCYDGKFALLGENQPAGIYSVAVLALFLVLGSATVLMTRGMTLL